VEKGQAASTSLKKEAEGTSSSLKKEKKRSLKSDVQVSGKLVLAAEVRILSYVGTDKMKKRTFNQMRDLIPQPVMAKIITYKTSWQQTGLGGNGGYCLCPAVKEAKAWGLETYAMGPGDGPLKHHGKGFMDITQAVDQWMEDMNSQALPILFS
jgi:hypothetical protein